MSLYDAEGKPREGGVYTDADYAIDLQVRDSDFVLGCAWFHRLASSIESRGPVPPVHSLRRLCHWRLCALHPESPFASLSVLHWLTWAFRELTCGLRALAFALRVAQKDNSPYKNLYESYERKWGAHLTSFSVSTICVSRGRVCCSCCMFVAFSCRVLVARVCAACLLNHSRCSSHLVEMRLVCLRLVSSVCSVDL